MSSFHVDGRISIKLEYDLAVRLAEFILNSGTEDKQVLALAHKLSQIDDDEQQPLVKKKFYKEGWSSWDEETSSQEKPYSKEDVYPKEGVYSKEGMYSKEQSLENNWQEEKRTPIRIRRSQKI